VTFGKAYEEIFGSRMNTDRIEGAEREDINITAAHKRRYSLVERCTQR
jgi:hypothetical protein